MKYSVCIDALFPNNVSAGIKAAANFGFAVEFWKWWNKDVEEIKRCLDENNVTLSAFCTQFVPLTVFDRLDEYIDGLKQSIAIAEKLGCKTLISQVGNDTGDERALQHASIVSGLKKCAPYLESSGITLVIEPLNDKINHPGYYLTKSREAFDIVREVGSDFVKVLFDIYHQQITEGDIVRNMLADVGLIGHVHCAGSDGRNELYYGELDYAYIFEKLRKAGYDGYIGLEYSPVDESDKGLEYVKKLGV